MRLLSATILLFAAGLAKAALVDNGTYTTDTGSGLDWLDLDQTDGLSPIDALAANSGWRYATFTEIDTLYSTAFPSAPDDIPYDEFGVYDNDPGTYQNAVDFVSLFGVTDMRGSLLVSSGIYYDDSGEVLAMSIQPQAPQNNYYYLYKHVRDYITIDYTEDPTFSDYRRGSYLVRTSVVPLPAAVWFFGSALIGLGWFRREQDA
jgi:hypothetical protein